MQRWLRRRRQLAGRIGLPAATALALLVTGLPAGQSAAGAPAAAATPPASWQQAGYRPAPCNTAAAGAADATPQARCYALGLTAEDGSLVQDESDPLPTSLGPADIQSAYRLGDGGDGRTVAIVDAYGYDAAEADLAVFRAHYGLPPCTSANGCFRKVDQTGGTDYPAQDEGWSVETSLDLDAVSSACPKCHILLVQADNNGSDNLGAAVDTAARLGATAISNSYGIAGESPYEARWEKYYDHPGIAVTASTGDIGDIQSFPATDPDVVAVGGTSLARDSSARGWQESAWYDGGSGCSISEPRPAYQAGLDTGCPDTRATADISADADPDSGLAVYNTFGQDGWAQWGGTSLASPLIAAMYALAGTPVPGTYPVTYPYRNRASGGLFDVTDGSNGYCADQLCNARVGWDGPTGLGTPDGVGALTLGAYGEVSGTVTNGSRRGALAGVTITATDADGNALSAVTDGAGRYTLALPVGDYTVVAAAFGYRSQSASGVRITDGGRLTRDFGLAVLPTRTVTGTVTDGSGHGWPLYATVAIDGYPGGPVFTDPFTGRYRVDLPVGTSYTLHVAPVDASGYLTRTVSIAVDPAGRGNGGDVRADVTLAVDTAACAAAGYATSYDGASADFTGWGTQAQAGWRVTDEAGSGRVWRFDDPAGKGNLTGGTGDFAIVDGWYNPGTQDTSLISPAVDLSGQSSPVIGFDTDYQAWNNQSADVDVSTDGGATWTGVWHASTQNVQGHVEIPIPQAAGKSGVRVRFRYQGAYADWWELDDVFVGSRSCDPVAGGLVAGFVRDANTAAPVVGATVTAGASTTPGGSAAEVATSRETAADPALADGFYSLFAPAGASLAASGRHYADAAATPTIAATGVTRQDWRLQAGHLTVHAADLSVNARAGQTAYRQIRLTNDGRQPVQVSLLEQDRGFTAAGGRHQSSAPGAPLVRIAGKTSVSAATAARAARPAGTAAAPAAAGDTAWSNLPQYPLLIMDNLVSSNDGTLYSVAGSDDNGVTAKGYRYDAQAGAWRAIADLPAPREAPVGGFVDGRLFVVGGWDEVGDATSTTYAYDPDTDRWSRRADLPEGVAAGAATTVDGRLYVVAGCTTGACEPASSATYRYDPDTDTWTKLADYPAGLAFLACAGDAGGVVCAGGVDPQSGYPTDATYQYLAGSDTWVKTTSMPFYDWGMSYAGVGGKLQIVGGEIAGSISNQAAEYDPSTGAWSSLPNANNALYRGGAACGLYQVGGSTYAFNSTPLVQQLPGYDSCVQGSDVGWLSTDRSQLVVPAGQSVTVTVAVSAARDATRGEYDARLAFVTDTPYTTQPLPVVMTVH